MLGWCLAYIYASVAFGAFLAVLGYRHRVWSRADARRSNLLSIRDLRPKLARDHRLGATVRRN